MLLYQMIRRCLPRLFERDTNLSPVTLSDGDEEHMALCGLSLRVNGEWFRVDSGSLLMVITENAKKIAQK